MGLFKRKKETEEERRERHLREALEIYNNAESYDSPSMDKAYELFGTAILEGSYEAAYYRTLYSYYGWRNIEQDYEVSFDRFKFLVEAKHDDREEYYLALNRLVECYYYGRGTEINYKEVLNKSREGVEAGHMLFHKWIGILYYHGYGVKQSYKKSLEHHEKASKESGYSAYIAGCIYYNGIGVEEDEKKRYEYFKLGAELGNGEALVCLGNCYRFRAGCELYDYQEAFNCYKKAADMEIESAYMPLAECYAEGIGCCVANSLVLKYYKKAAEAGIEGAAERYNQHYLWFEEIKAENLMKNLKIHN